METAQKLRNYQYENNKDNKFDIDLKFGVQYENSLADILSMGKIEVKTERDKWKSTGNIAIELRCRGKKSGLAVTKADWWAHILSLKNEIKGVILIPVDKMKKIVKKSVKEGNGMIVMGGDDDASELALIPLKDIADGF